VYDAIACQTVVARENMNTEGELYDEKKGNVPVWRVGNVVLKCKKIPKIIIDAQKKKGGGGDHQEYGGTRTPDATPARGHTSPFTYALKRRTVKGNGGQRRNQTDIVKTKGAGTKTEKE